MTIRQVKYSASQALSCESCVPAKVIFATVPGLVADSYADLKGFIEAEIVEVTTIAGGGRIYTLEYDDVQLADENTEIIPTDILGIFCNGLREEWVIDKARREVEP